uniref:Immunoglobulin superfamily, member 5b n=1 Tax=Erpetoichthys calabaricus TaxID=27687 RepID=A0A8C4X7C8_ERPCA
MMYCVASILLLFTAGIASEKILQGPKNAAVLENGTASFNCTLTRNWQVLIWMLRSSLVLTVIENFGPIETLGHFTSRNYTNGDSLILELIISEVSLNNSGVVACKLQGGGTAEANLFVQVNGTLAITNHNLVVVKNTSQLITCQAIGWLPIPEIKWKTNGTLMKSYSNNSILRSDHLYDTINTLKVHPLFDMEIECIASISALPEPLIDRVHVTVIAENGETRFDRAVLIAVTVTISVLTVIILLIIGLVLFCKRKKEPGSSYQDKKSSATQEQTQNGSASMDWNKGGQVNLAYSTENSSGTYSGDLSRNQNMSFSNSKVSDVRNISTDDSMDFVNSHYSAQHSLSPKKIRHLTVV